MRPVFLRAAWRKLLMLQYPVEPELLMPYLPRGVELDLWQGRAYVSLVGFLFARTRIRGVPVPFHRNFEEVNLRFYVKRREPDGEVRRGVVFVNEFVPRRAISWVAKTFYDEPYRTMPMRHRFVAEKEGRIFAEYAWKCCGRWHSMSAEADAGTGEIAAGSFEEFITEHYWGYTRRRNGFTSTYQVEHVRWKLHRVHAWRLEADYAAMYGERWAFLNNEWAEHVLLAEGSPVTVRGGFRI